MNIRSLRLLPNLEKDPSLLEACPVAPINPKTRLGSPWSSQNTRRRKPLPLPPQDWQHLPMQALCPLSKARAPDPARPLRPPTHLTKTTMMKTRQRKKRGVKEVRFHPHWRLLTRGTASLRQLRPQVQTPPPMEEARPALPAQGAAGARNGRRRVLRSHLPVTKFSFTLSPPLALPLQLSA